jgi:fluoroacetyl-CoA thioesterase
MHSALAPGLTHIQTLEMNDRLIVSAAADGAPPAFATAFVAGLMEWACIEALRPYLDDGEQSIGSHIYISHAAPSPLSAKLTAIAELVEIKGAALRFRVDCYDECEQIGSGFHERTVVGPVRCAPGVRDRDTSFHA